MQNQTQSNYYPVKPTYLETTTDQVSNATPISPGRSYRLGPKANEETLGYLVLLFLILVPVLLCFPITVYCCLKRGCPGYNWRKKRKRWNPQNLPHPPHPPVPKPRSPSSTSYNDETGGVIERKEVNIDVDDKKETTL